MKLDPKDRTRLWDILDAAHAIIQFIEGKDYDDFVQNRLLRNAVERNLEIIGEASGKLSLQVREDISGIPWSSIKGLRNVLAHEYGEIQYEKVWALCVNRLPEFIEQLEAIGVGEPPIKD